MTSQEFASNVLQMLEQTSVKAGRDQIKGVSDMYELLDGLASGDLTIVAPASEPEDGVDDHG